MATNQTGIAIIIKAWLPVAGPISEQIAKLQMVEDAHKSGDYATLLKTATVEEVKTEQKTRRVDEPAAPAAAPTEAGEQDEQAMNTETLEPAPPLELEQTTEAEHAPTEAEPARGRRSRQTEAA